MRVGWLGILCAVGCGRTGFDHLADAGAGGDGSVGPACSEPMPITTPAWWVAPTGSDAAAGTQAQPFATITHAVSVAGTTGGTIVVAPGAYAAEPGDEVGITTTVPLRIVSEQRYGASVPRFDCQGCRDVSIEGFEVGGASPPTISVTAGTRVTILDNVVRDSNSAGIRITSGSSEIDVAGNLVYDHFATSIHVNDGFDVTIRGNVVFDASAANSGLSRIWIEDGTRTTVAGNVVFGVLGDHDPYGLISLRLTTMTLVENNIIGASPAATNGFAAFGFDQTSGTAVIRHNTIVGPLPGAAFGLGVSSVMPATTVTIVNNVWASAGTPQPFTAGMAPASTMSIQRNLYWNAPDGPFVAGGSPSAASDATAIVADPAIAAVQPTAPVWSTGTRTFGGGATTICDVRGQLVESLAALPATSPAVGAADQAQRPGTDIRGRPRPTQATVGAYEPGL